MNLMLEQNPELVNPNNIQPILIKQPKIIYATRTHSQLNQVVKELSRTNYNPKMCVLGSRKQYCINPKVSKIQSTNSQNYLCRSLVSNQKCNYHSNVKGNRHNFFVKFHKKKKDFVSRVEHPGVVMDIEEIVSIGRGNHVCPYYLSRERQRTAEIIFLPYNYLVDSSMRQSFGIDVEGSIIIFDEAHNLESVCMESSSFDISTDDLTNCISQISNCLDGICYQNDPNQQCNQEEEKES